MKKLIATIALVIAFSSTAHAVETTEGTVESKPAAMNGLMLNGLSVNGITINGLSVNGWRLNGILWNGWRLNGLTVNALSKKNTHPAMSFQGISARPLGQ